MAIMEEKQGYECRTNIYCHDKSESSYGDITESTIIASLQYKSHKHILYHMNLFLGINNP